MKISMVNRFKDLFLLIPLLWVSWPLQAQALPSFLPPNTAGSGCPLGTSPYRLLNNNQTLEIKFQALEVGSRPGMRQRTSCNLALPIKVPAGYQIAALPLRFRILSNLQQGQARLSRSYMYLGQNYQDEDKVTIIKSSAQQPIQVITDNLSEQKWYGCGEDINLRINIILTLQSNQGTVAASLLSTNPNNPDHFDLVYRKCTTNP